jgi:xylulokinase
VSWDRVLLTGGAVKSPAIRELAPGIFGRDVEVPEPEEYVALGAARQAAWALTGDDAPPSWPRRTAAVYSGAPSREIRERHAALRDDTAPWKEGTPL